MVQTDTWCSSNYHGEDHAIHLFTLCNNDSGCDWVELNGNLTNMRVIVVSGRGVFTYEFYPRKDSLPSSFYLSLLRGTIDNSEENNLYLFLHLLSGSNLFIFANKRSISFDYMNNKVKNYPSICSSILLSLRGNDLLAKVLVCGGALSASKTCRRLKLTDLNLVWSMETMSMPHVMPDMLLLPINDVVFINGANHSTVGSNDAKHSNFNQRFTILNSSNIPMMYQSSVLLLPNGNILVGGSNPHEKCNFTLDPYPTNLSLKAFYPPYWPHSTIFYGPQSLTIIPSGGEISVSFVTPSSTMYSFAMNQRMVVLNVFNIERAFMTTYQIVVNGPLLRRWHYLGII
ncbi:glyoxal oxidase-related protein [Citrus sinensis]|nr:glyoxal oxidase-related protein [Citrus sinensis]